MCRERHRRLVEIVMGRTLIRLLIVLAFLVSAASWLLRPSSDLATVERAAQPIVAPLTYAEEHPETLRDAPESTNDLVARSAVAAMNKEYDAALHDLDLAVRSDPEEIDLRLKRLRAHGAAGHPGAAFADYRYLDDLAFSALAYSNRAWPRSDATVEAALDRARETEAAGDWDLAVLYYSKAMSSHLERHVAAAAHRGFCSFERGNYGAALSDFQIARRGSPQPGLADDANCLSRETWERLRECERIARARLSGSEEAEEE